MNYHENVLNLIGRTPLVRLNRMAQGIKATVLAKMESLNPGYSVKDRIGISMVETARRIARETPNSFYPDQYSNPNNPEAHYRTTGPELWEQTEGRITHFVAGLGTGGTISGTGRFLKEKNPDI